MKLEDRFAEVLTSEAEVRAILGAPGPVALRKALDHLNEPHQRIIQRSSFVLISSCDSKGMMDISPKGDPEGFVRILDPKTLAIPDRPGNRRADTLINLLTNDRVAVLFLVPGKGETLRVSGRGIVVRDPSLRETMTFQGKTPELAIVLEVEEAFSHCPKCVIRSHLWSPDQWPDHTDLPTHAEALHLASKVEMPVSQFAAIVEKDFSERLY